MPHRRNALPAGFSMLAAAAKAAENIPNSDCELLALADEIRAAVDAFNAGLAEYKASGCTVDDFEQLEQQLLNHINELIDRLVAIPADGFAGVAAKVAWLCESQMQSGTADAPLINSIMADLARHQPEAVAPVVRESSGPETRRSRTGN